MSNNPTQPAAASSERRLFVGHWPHLRARDSVPKIMWSVAAALVPALVASGYFFGFRAYLHVGLAVATAVITEAVITRLRHKKATVGDGSAVVTGLLVAFCLPAQARWFVPIVAAFVAIAIAKQCFGGLGANIWNPALVGRAFVHFSFPEMNVSSYPLLTGQHFLGNVGTFISGVPERVDAISGATPMAHLKAIATGQTDAASVLSEKLPGLWDMLLGRIGGSLGETSALLLILGALYLIYKGWVRWQIPVAYLATVALGALALPLRFEAGWHPILTASPDLAARYVTYHLLGGGLMLGAFFMATDMVTSPLTNKGMLLFGFGCGALTILIRLYGGYPEAVCYSILLMNTVVPLIDRWTQPRIFGHKK
ncbi:MAG TPA: RnfABCDGE type electron transport complex subunit D [Phycisphaerae bacterium]|nr:RnfABCDGE type electron transport complex subunit D [Phycisphaerae bacterium]